MIEPTYSGKTDKKHSFCGMQNLKDKIQDK